MDKIKTKILLKDYKKILIRFVISVVKKTVIATNAVKNFNCKS